MKSLINEVIKDIKDAGIQYYNQKKLQNIKSNANQENDRCCWFFRYLFLFNFKYYNISISFKWHIP